MSQNQLARRTANINLMQIYVNVCKIQLTSCKLDRLDMYVPETILRSRCTTAGPAWHVLPNFDHKPLHSEVFAPDLRTFFA